MNDVIWITYNGRRIPIKPGMKGKFKKKSDFYNNLSKEEKKKYDNYLKKGYTEKDIEDTLMFKTQEDRMKEAGIEFASDEYKLYKQAKENPDSIDPMTENSTDWEALDKKYSKRYNEENWRELIKKNNEETEKITRDLEKRMNDPEYKYHRDKWEDEYYGAFRENERRNAKIKIEKPEELYENVPAYAGYEEKSWRLSGSRKNEDGSTDFGNKSWSGKEYTNDEFMEHLTDSNWHRERRMLEDAKLTNQELSYIKDRTTLSQWGVGEELTGEKNVNKLIREAKQYYSKDKGFAKRYEGSIDYLQQNTNLSYSQIIELLKKIDKERK